MSLASYLYPHVQPEQLEGKAKLLEEDLAELSKARGAADWYLQQQPFDSI
jgi:hypothetical protein